MYHFICILLFKALVICVRPKPGWRGVGHSYVCKYVIILGIHNIGFFVAIQNANILQLIRPIIDTDIYVYFFPNT